MELAVVASVGIRQSTREAGVMSIYSLRLITSIYVVN